MNFWTDHNNTEYLNDTLNKVKNIKIRNIDILNELNMDVDTKYYLKIINSIQKSIFINFALLSDLYRYLILREYGGLYLDVDVEIYNKAPENQFGTAYKKSDAIDILNFFCERKKITVNLCDDYVYNNIINVPIILRNDLISLIKMITKNFTRNNYWEKLNTKIIQKEDYTNEILNLAGPSILTDFYETLAQDKKESFLFQETELNIKNSYHISKTDWKNQQNILDIDVYSFPKELSNLNNNYFIYAGIDNDSSSHWSNYSKKDIHIRDDNYITYNMKKDKKNWSGVTNIILSPANILTEYPYEDIYYKISNTCYNDINKYIISIHNLFRGTPKYENFKVFLDKVEDYIKKHKVFYNYKTIENKNKEDKINNLDAQIKELWSVTKYAADSLNKYFPYAKYKEHLNLKSDKASDLSSSIQNKLLKLSDTYPEILKKELF
ncbi:glycosyltransferase [Francisella frigiditurris]|uniref:Glycosyltransferase sugar-binding region containing DXD motif family protein n=1 Tax=Francisella frigiditurris TaxID=1542390 RepID=A0A1J0KW71_9GAMM|nr:glycosyltransferase [Francisella frigiditurris]APC97930.1 glycosyltransferase sugar-binding region containing DXD motif family protein [Francisella frigiditurris]